LGNGGIVIVAFYQITAVKKDEQVDVDFTMERESTLDETTAIVVFCRILNAVGGRKMLMSVRYPKSFCQTLSNA
jgi:hypothetical protein